MKFPREITQAVPEDVPRIMHILEETALATYPNAEHGITREDVLYMTGKMRVMIPAIQAIMRVDQMRAWKALVEGQIVGFIACRKGELTNSISYWYVLSKFQGDGIGSELMQKALSFLGEEKDIELEVVAHNTDSIRRYKSLGFIDAGEYVSEFLKLEDGRIFPERKMIRKAGVIVEKGRRGVNIMTKLNPYISFKDNAREAMEFYQSVFGGKLTMNTFGEFHASEDPAEAEKIMHAMLESENGIVFMGSDTPNRMEYIPGKNISMSLSGEPDNEAELRGYWEKLVVGGKENMPLDKAPWGDTFGMLTDKFGIDWMVNIAGPKA